MTLKPVKYQLITLTSPSIHSNISKVNLPFV
jgi:hypothetical protein